MIRAPRPRRSLLLATGLTVLLAIPAGVLAAHDFADVPDSNIFHNDISALVDAGVTAGCGGGNYCPNQAVTRGQMAAFMNRLGALAPGKIPVVNADRVDGLHAVSFVRAGVDVRADGTRGQWFNRGGGAPTVVKDDTGRYLITIPGKSFNINNNFVGSVTLVDLGFGRISSVGGTQVLVETYNTAGAPADMRFQVLVWDASTGG